MAEGGSELARLACSACEMLTALLEDIGDSLGAYYTDVEQLAAEACSICQKSKKNV